MTYDVVIAVPNPDLKLFPGMTANVKIMVDRAAQRDQGAEQRIALPSGDRNDHNSGGSGSQGAISERGRQRQTGCGRTAKIGLDPGQQQAGRGEGDNGSDRRHLHRNHRRHSEGRRPGDSHGACEVGRAGRGGQRFQPAAERDGRQARPGVLGKLVARS